MWGLAKELRWRGEGQCTLATPDANSVQKEKKTEVASVGGAYLCLCHRSLRYLQTRRKIRADKRTDKLTDSTNDQYIAVAV